MHRGARRACARSAPSGSRAPPTPSVGVRGDLSEFAGRRGRGTARGGPRGRDDEVLRRDLTHARRAPSSESRARSCSARRSATSAGARTDRPRTRSWSPPTASSAPRSPRTASAGLRSARRSPGCRPIVELMFPDFALEAADQLFNHIAKARHVYGGTLPVPVVVRTRTAQGRGFGPQHSADPAALFALFPGWRITAPSTPADYVGLLNAALLCEDPVLVIEHHALWPVGGDVPTRPARLRPPSRDGAPCPRGRGRDRARLVAPAPSRARVSPRSSRPRESRSRSSTLAGSTAPVSTAA